MILCNLLSALSSFSPGRGGANEQLTMLEGQHTTVLYMYVLKRTIDVDIIYIHPFKQSFWNLLTFSLHLLSKNNLKFNGSIVIYDGINSTFLIVFTVGM